MLIGCVLVVTLPPRQGLKKLDVDLELVARQRLLIASKAVPHAHDTAVRGQSVDPIHFRSRQMPVLLMVMS